MKPVNSPNVWTIVLAAGDRAPSGDLPSFSQTGDLKKHTTSQPDIGPLRAAVARARRWSRPEHIVVVVSALWHELAFEQLRSADGVCIVAQPKDLGTGPGLLLPLAHVSAREAGAHVVVLPAGLYVRDEAALTESIYLAISSSLATQAPVLVGAVPQHADTGRGWLVTAKQGLRCAAPMELFVDKPGASLAKRLLARGALWNTMIMTGSVNDFKDLADRHMPQQSACFERLREAIGSKHEAQLLTNIYNVLVPADFSREVLQWADGLLVVPLMPCGWSDRQPHEHPAPVPRGR
jgi:mannose-1-phosphate guanylyltransferase